MAFVWVEGTAVGDIIHKADIDEIHTNIDSIKDNLANITHDDGVLSTHRGTYLLNNYTNYNTDRESANYDDHDSLINTTKYTSDNAGANSGYNGDDNSSDYAAYCASVEVGNNWRQCDLFEDPYIFCNMINCPTHNQTNDSPYYSEEGDTWCTTNYQWNRDGKEGCGPFSPSCTAFS